MARIKYNYSGFTLIELLVVIAIIGILITIATANISVSSHNNNLNKISSLMDNTFNLLQQESVISFKTYGIVFFYNGYKIVEKHDNQWKIITNPNIYKKINIPSFIKLNLKLNSNSNLSTVLYKDSEKLQPQVILYPKGYITPFEIVLSIPKKEKIITGKENGVILLKS